jgi:antitoxin (DNA-binding transcriptional repressor) of toxin-antitoxin stability system
VYVFQDKRVLSSVPAGEPGTYRFSWRWKNGPFTVLIGNLDRPGSLQNSLAAQTGRGERLEWYNTDAAQDRPFLLLRRSTWEKSAEARGVDPVQTIAVQQAEGHLSEIIENLSPGEEVVLTRDNQPVATLRAVAPAPRKPPRFGTLKGSIVSIAPGFDVIPEGFEDYLP